MLTLSSAERPTAARRDDLVAALLRAVAASLAVAVWFFAAVFWLRADSFSAVGAGAVLFSAFLLLTLSAGAHFFRQLACCWFDYPYAADEFFFRRDHLLISVPVIFSAFLFFSIFSFAAALVCFVILAFGEAVFWRTMPVAAALGTARIRGASSGADVCSESPAAGPQIFESPLDDSPSAESPAAERQIFESPLDDSPSAERPSAERPESAVAGFLPGLFGGTEEETIRIGPFDTSNEFRADLYDGEVSEEEESEPDEAETAVVSRRRIADGVERLEGWQRVSFALGEEVAVTYLSFCPPLAKRPAITLFQLSGPEAQITATQIQTFGARLEIKRRGGAERLPFDTNAALCEGVAAESVRVGFFAEG